MKWKDSNDGAETVAGEEGTFEEDYSPLRTRKLDFGSRLASIITRPGSWLVIITSDIVSDFFPLYSSWWQRQSPAECNRPASPANRKQDGGPGRDQRTGDGS